jgi:GrpB-like predicted nucleotidyltransferase (UPF0157 family)
MDGLPPDYVQPRPRLAGPVVLAEPDPTWARQYADEEARVRAALGDRVLQLEHVGSTSVEGLAAKPVIDIVLVVADSADEAAYVPDLEAAGYLLYLREPGWHEHRLLRGKEPLVHLHVFSPGGPEVERLLLFRDRLRTQPDDRELYQRSKRDLAARRWEYVQDYADAKSAVVEEIIARARAEET